MNKNVFNDLVVVKRSGQRVSFNSSKIGLAIKYAFNDVGDKYNEKEINKVFQEVLTYINNNYKDRKTINIEDIQDIIELILKEKKYNDVYEAFYSYRNKRKESRQAFSIKKEHKFVKFVETINNSIDLPNLNPEESLFDFGKTISSSYIKSFIIDNKCLKAYEEGKIYIHDIPYFNLGYLSSVDLILDKYLKEDLCYSKFINELLNAKKEVSGDISVTNIDVLLKKYLLKVYKENLVKNISNYLKIFGFSEFINLKKISDVINKCSSLVDDDLFSSYFINEQIEKIINLSKKEAEASAKKYLSVVIKEMFLTLNDNYLSGNKKYLFSLGIDKTPEGLIVKKIIIDTLKNLKPLNYVFINYKITFNDEFFTSIVDLINDGKNITISNEMFSLDKGKNIAYFSNGERLFCYDNYSIGKMIICKTSINMARLGLKYKSLSKEFFAELNDIMELAKTNNLQIFELIGDKKNNNYKILFKNNILDDEKLEDNQKIRKVIKNGTLNINLVGLMECALTIDKSKPYLVINKILKYLNAKIDDFYQETKLNFVLSCINYESASKHFIEIDKALYGVINRITNKVMYEDLSIIKNGNDLENVEMYQKYLNGGNNCVVVNKKLIQTIFNYDIGYISFNNGEKL